jgi:hypothetical protein
MCPLSHVVPCLRGTRNFMSANACRMAESSAVEFTLKIKIRFGNILLCMPRSNSFEFLDNVLYSIFFLLALQPPWALASSFRFTIILQTVGFLGRGISSSQGLYLNTRQHKHRINIYTHTKHPCIV